MLRLTYTYGGTFSNLERSINGSIEIAIVDSNWRYF